MPYSNGRPQQRWRSSIDIMMIFFRGVSPHFSSLLVIRWQRGRNLS
jgi:hypothetical protein